MQEIRENASHVFWGSGKKVSSAWQKLAHYFLSSKRKEGNDGYIAVG